MKGRLPVISLIVISIISGALWRLEVEYHGWTGLIWLSYFHLAIPLGFVLFLFWSNFFIKVELKNGYC